MSSPHYSNGQLILKDVNTSSWYYISVVIGEDGVAYLSPAQVAASVPAVPVWSESVVMQAVNGDYYRLELYSLDGVIYTNPTLLATPEPAYRVFLRTSGIRYEVYLDEDDQGDIYLALRLASAAPTSDLCSPWKLVSAAASLAARTHSPATSLTPTTIAPAGVYCQREILVPTTT